MNTRRRTSLDADYLGIYRSENCIFIQLIFLDVATGAGPFYEAVVDELEEKLQVRPRTLLQPHDGSAATSMGLGVATYVRGADRPSDPNSSRTDDCSFGPRRANFDGRLRPTYSDHRWQMNNTTPTGATVARRCPPKDAVMATPATTLKKVLITGAGTGFGYEVAMRLAEKGFDVVAAVEIYGQVQTLKRQADERGVTLRVEKLDVTDDGDRRKAWDWGIEILVNNAGVGEGGSTVDIPGENIRHQFEVNVTGPLLLTQGIAKQMASGSGRIIWCPPAKGSTSTPLPAFTPPPSTP